MTFTNNELSELLDLLKSKNVYRFKANGLEVEFSGIEELPQMEDTTEVIDNIDDKAPTEYELHKSFQQL